MADQKEEKEIRNYCAFISYRHKPLDMQAARKVQNAIERYVIPKELRKPPERKKFGYVFRDEDELPVGSSLSDSIVYALDHSEFLIVICTPDLPESKWCEQEITYFLKTHDRSHVLAVLADGEPAESFSPYLLHTYDEEGNVLTDVEPLAANIAGENHTISRKAFAREITRIYAALLDVPFDTLWQRERRARTARVTGVLSVIIAALSVFLGVTLRQNAVIKEQNRQQKIRLSSMLVDSGTKLLDEYHPKEALADALSALADPDPAIYDHRAEKLLVDATHAYWRGDVQIEAVYEQSTSISDLAVTADGSKAFLIDQMGYVRCVNPKTGERLWENASWEDGQDPGDEDSRMLLSESAGAVICKNAGNVCALSAADGSLLWNAQQELESYFAVLSDDGQKLALLEQQTLYGESGFYYQTEVLFLDAATGEEQGRVHFLDDDAYTIKTAYTTAQTYGGAFSESGRYFAFALCEEALEQSGTDETSAEEDSAEGEAEEEDAEKEEPVDVYAYYVMDTETMKVVRRWETTIATSTSQLYYGVHVDEKTMDLFAVQYSPVHGAILSGVCYGDDPEHTEFYSHGYELRASNGEFYMWLSAAACPVLYNENLALVTSESTLLIYGLSDGRLRKSYDMSGTILDIFWEDVDEDQVCLLLSDGGIAEYDLAHSDDGVIDGYWLYSMDQSGLTLGKHLADSTYKEAVYDWMTVREEKPGELLVSAKAEDENGVFIPNPEEAAVSRIHVLPEPSGAYFFILYDPGVTDTETVTAVRYRTSDLAEDARCVLDLRYVSSSWDAPAALNADEILCADTIYRMDGTTRPLENVTDENRYLLSGSLHQKRLSDGRLLCAADLSGGSPTYNEFWIDGEKVSVSEKARIALQGKSGVFEAGENGLVVTYGYLAVQGEDGEAIVSETPEFIAYDVIRDVRYEIEDRFSDSSGRAAAVADSHPWFACGYENGRVCIYELKETPADAAAEDSADVKQLDQVYSPGEIRDLHFADNDAYLVIQTITGRVDLIRLSDGAEVFSQTLAALQERPSAVIRSVETDPANSRMVLMFASDGAPTGYLLGLDTRAWVMSLETDGTYGWMPDGNRICYPAEDGVLAYPAYSLDDLLQRAQEFYVEKGKEE